MRQRLSIVGFLSVCASAAFFLIAAAAAHGAPRQAPDGKAAAPAAAPGGGPADPRLAEEFARRPKFYVSTAGSNGNNGSAGFPFRTIQKAADVARPGDTVLIRPGVYREQVRLRTSGTAEKRITFRAWE